MLPQERADRLTTFRRELAELERLQILQLTPDQRARLDAYLDGELRELVTRHDVDTTRSGRQISLGMRIASALGGLALCVAVVLFFIRFMGSWPTAVQVAALVGAPIALTIATAIIARREQSTYYTALLTLVTCAAFGANLSLMGSIFNLAPTPNVLAVWGAFALALACHFGIRLVLAGGLVSIIGWIVGMTSYWRGWWWIDFDRRAEEVMLISVAVAVAPLVIRQRLRPTFPPVYRLVGSIMFFLAVLLLSESGSSSQLSWNVKTIEHAYQVFGLVAAVTVVWIGIRQGWSGMVNVGTIFFTLFLFLRLVDWWWDSLPKYAFFLLVGLVAVGLLALFKRLRRRVREAT